MNQQHVSGASVNRAASADPQDNEQMNLSMAELYDIEEQLADTTQFRLLASSAITSTTELPSSSLEFMVSRKDGEDSDEKSAAIACQLLAAGSPMSVSHDKGKVEMNGRDGKLRLPSSLAPVPTGTNTSRRRTEKPAEGHIFGDRQDDGLDLVVATMVIEEDEDDREDAVHDGLPRAEPMQKLKGYSTCCLVSLLTVVFVSIAFFVVCFVVIPYTHNGNESFFMEDDPQDEPVASTASSTTHRESLGIQEQLAKVVGISQLTNATSPHYKALQWILHEDPVVLPESAPNLVQRYTLALFYFATTANGPWRSCNPPIIGSGETHVCQFQQLMWVTHELEFEVVTRNRWLGHTHECDWVGITCEGEQVIRLILDAHKISGNLPQELGLLKNLESLSLVHNEMTGPLPVSLAGDWHDSLTQVELQGNSFSGTIPREWFEFKFMIRMNLGENLFTGSLPTELGLLGIGHSGMEDSTLGVFLEYNYGLTGTIPSEIGLLEELAFLRLHRTGLQGFIPTEVGLLTNLQEFWVYKSNLSGTIPTEIALLTSMRQIRLHETQISGVIPDVLFDLPLESFDAWQTKLGGTISPKIGQWGDSLTTLRLQNNSFTGEIPSEMGLLANIEELYLQHNEITGFIPKSICDKIIGAMDEIIRVIKADCIVPSNQTNLLPASFVSCELGCCNVCCDRDTQICSEMAL